MGQVRKSIDQLSQLQIEIDNFIRDSLGEGQARGRGEHVHQPQIDVYETGDHLHIDVDLPGIRKEDITCDISSNRVFVEARKKASSPEKTAHYFCMERLFGRFKREIEIPTIVNTRSVEARLDNGILRIKMPKIPDRREKRRRVEIK